MAGRACDEVVVHGLGDFHIVLEFFTAVYVNLYGHYTGKQHKQSMIFFTVLYNCNHFCCDYDFFDLPYEKSLPVCLLESCLMLQSFMFGILNPHHQQQHKQHHHLLLHLHHHHHHQHHDHHIHIICTYIHSYIHT